VGFEASHLPSVVHCTPEGATTIEMHVARPNKLIEAAGNGAPAMAIFPGPSAYVHPGWYPSKAVDQKAVPTWSYVAVHAQGTLSCFDGEDLMRHLKEFTDKHEAGRTEPWSVSDAPVDYIRKLARAIVGIRLKVERIEGSWKLQQHHSISNRRGLVEGLEAEGSATAREMARVIAATLID